MDGIYIFSKRKTNGGKWFIITKCKKKDNDFSNNTMQGGLNYEKHINDLYYKVFFLLYEFVTSVRDLERRCHRTPVQIMRS